jgi:enoyl-CoA hydratase/carnithine racemase
MPDVTFSRTGPDDAVAVVTLDRPERLNAYTLDTLKELEPIWDAVRDDPGIRVAILAGAGGRAFSTGHDISWVNSLDPEEEALRPEYYGPEPVRYLHGYGAYGIDIRKPLIAAIDGYCVGGGLAMACRCDLRICSQGSRFGVPQVKLGVISPQACVFLPHIVGLGTAMEMIMTGDLYDTDFALRTGLVNRVAGEGQALDEALGLAARLCQVAPLALQASKQVVLAGLQSPIETALDLGHRTFAWLRGTADGREGPLAFSQKREPRWTGR